VHQKTAAQQKAGMMLVCLGSCLEIMIVMNDNLKSSVVSLYHLASLHRDVFSCESLTPQQVWWKNKKRKETRISDNAAILQHVLRQPSRNGKSSPTSTPV
jgi:hypothetical protein